MPARTNHISAQRIKRRLVACGTSAFEGPNHQMKPTPKYRHRFPGPGAINHRLRQDDSAFRHPNAGGCVHRGHAHDQRLRIGEPDVLSGEAHHAARDKDRLVACLKWLIGHTIGLHVTTLPQHCHIHREWIGHTIGLHALSSHGTVTAQPQSQHCHSTATVTEGESGIPSDCMRPNQWARRRTWYTTRAGQ